MSNPRPNLYEQMIPANIFANETQRQFVIKVLQAFYCLANASAHQIKEQQEKNELAKAAGVALDHLVAYYQQIAPSIKHKVTTKTQKFFGLDTEHHKFQKIICGAALEFLKLHHPPPQNQPIDDYNLSLLREYFQRGSTEEISKADADLLLGTKDESLRYFRHYQSKNNATMQIPEKTIQSIKQNQPRKIQAKYLEQKNPESENCSKKSSLPNSLSGRPLARAPGNDEKITAPSLIVPNAKAVDLDELKEAIKRLNKDYRLSKVDIGSNKFVMRLKDQHGRYVFFYLSLDQQNLLGEGASGQVYNAYPINEKTGEPLTKKVRKIRPHLSQALPENTVRPDEFEDHELKYVVKVFKDTSEKLKLNVEKESALLTHYSESAIYSHIVSKENVEAEGYLFSEKFSGHSLSASKEKIEKFDFIQRLQAITSLLDDSNRMHHLTMSRAAPIYTDCLAMVHADISRRNILIDTSTSSPSCRLIDFGESLILQDSADELVRDVFRGDMYRSAPETVSLFEKPDFFDLNSAHGFFGIKSDSFSLAFILAFLLGEKHSLELKRQQVYGLSLLICKEAEAENIGFRDRYTYIYCLKKRKFFYVDAQCELVHSAENDDEKIKEIFSGHLGTNLDQLAPSTRINFKYDECRRMFGNTYHQLPHYQRYKADIKNAYNADVLLKSTNAPINLTSLLAKVKDLPRIPVLEAQNIDSYELLIIILTKFLENMSNPAYFSRMGTSEALRFFTKLQNLCLFIKNIDDGKNYGKTIGKNERLQLVSLSSNELAKLQIQTQNSYLAELIALSYGLTGNNFSTIESVSRDGRRFKENCEQSFDFASEARAELCAAIVAAGTNKLLVTAIMCLESIQFFTAFNLQQLKRNPILVDAIFNLHQKNIFSKHGLDLLNDSEELCIAINEFAKFQQFESAIFAKLICNQDLVKAVSQICFAEISDSRLLQMLVDDRLLCGFVDFLSGAQILNENSLKQIMANPDLKNCVVKLNVTQPKDVDFVKACLALNKILPANDIKLLRKNPELVKLINKFKEKDLLGSESTRTKMFGGNALARLNSNSSLISAIDSMIEANLVNDADLVAVKSGPKLALAVQVCKKHNCLNTNIFNALKKFTELSTAVVIVDAKDLFDKTALENGPDFEENVASNFQQELWVIYLRLANYGFNAQDGKKEIYTNYLKDIEQPRLLGLLAALDPIGNNNSKIVAIRETLVHAIFEQAKLNEYISEKQQYGDKNPKGYQWRYSFRARDVQHQNATKCDAADKLREALVTGDASKLSNKILQLALADRRLGSRTEIIMQYYLKNRLPEPIDEPYVHPVVAAPSA